MSDDFDFDDSFQIDDSFLRQVDEIAASASAKPPQATSVVSRQNDFARASTLAVSGGGSSHKGWTGPQTTTSAGPNTSRPDPRAQQRALPQSHANTTLLEARPRRYAPNTASSSSIPSSRLGRTSSSGNGNGSGNAGDPFFQTHLNFRKERQHTKGKRWDRTVYAETGRRHGAEKGKGKSAVRKAKGRAWRHVDDEEDEDEGGDWDEDEMDWEGGIVPGPKPFVDPNKAYEPQRHLPNPSTIDSYIYPTNQPKRDYQYEIVRACFTDNCLVALPTGLGKTFVAGVVMLNFYRWFPTGKIVFLAPTKPLVNQQIEACQTTCGIPSADAAVMTGSSVSAKERARLWDERRVFYCTPQTLDNDLKKGSVDPRDIVLAVFDEAHKASGSYAYTTILAYLTAHHPYFRVLALTATPGADVPRVQAVVDALHISRIEIREAEAPEIRKYMNEKRTERHTVLMGDVIEGFRDRWAALMKPNVQKLVDKGILTERDLDIKRLKPFRLTAQRMEIARDRTSGLKWALGSLQSLERMARAMGHLLEFSLGMFHTLLLEIAGNQTAQGKKAGAKGAANSLRNNFEFQKLLRDVEAEMSSIRIGRGGKTKADRHPKMQKTLELLLAHFTQAADDERDHGIKNDTRAMVFCSFRDCVMEVVEMLNDHSPVLKATKFVGQAQGKQEGDKGFNQKEQKKTILDFKEGKYNILVSTSIGEEGLDIGEVDFVVIYDMPKQSIKLLQRVGRTGRKRDGRVHVLMSENREDANWDSAQQTHREIQEEILHSRNLELFEDVEALLPGGKVPECVEMEMAVDKFEAVDYRKSGGAAAKKPRVSNSKSKGGVTEGRAMATGRGHEVPDGVGTGFRSVKDLLQEKGRMPSGTKIAAARKKTSARELEDEDEQEEAEEEEEDESEADEDSEAERAILFGDLSAFKAKKRRRSDEGESMAQIKRAANERARKKVEAKPPRLTPSINGSGKSGGGSGKEKEKGRKATSSGRREQAEEDDRWAELNRSALDFFNGEGPIRFGGGSRPEVEEEEEEEVEEEGGEVARLPPSSPPSRRFAHRGDVDPDPAAAIDDDSLRKVEDGLAISSGVKADRLTPRTAAMAGFSQVGAIDLSWDPADEEDGPPSPLAIQQIRPPPPPAPPAPASSAVRRRTIGLARPKQTERLAPSTPLQPTKSTEAMPPPPIPASHSSHPLQPKSSSSPAKPPTPGMEATQFPVRRAGRRARVALSSARASEEESSPMLRRRRRVAESSSPERGGDAVLTRERTRPRQAGGTERGRDARKRRKIDGRAKEFLDLDVGVSGSESSDEASSSNDVESDSDRLFAGADFQPTQAPRGYDQRAMYLAGLSTQVAPKHGLAFRQLVDREAFLAKARQPVQVTDDEMTDDDGGGGQGGERSENEYELGSFVCADEDVSFATQSDPMSGV